MKTKKVKGINLSLAKPNFDGKIETRWLISKINDDKLNYGINEFLKGIIETGDHLSSYLDISEKKKIQNSIKNINFEKGNFIYNNQSLPEIVFIEKK